MGQWSSPNSYSPSTCLPIQRLIQGFHNYLRWRASQKKFKQLTVAKRSTLDVCGNPGSFFHILTVMGIGLPEIGHKGRDAKNYLKRGGSHKSGDGKFSKRKKCFVEKNKSNSLVKKYIKNINNFQI